MKLSGWRSCSIEAGIAIADIGAGDGEITLLLAGARRPCRPRLLHGNRARQSLAVEEADRPLRSRDRAGRGRGGIQSARRVLRFHPGAARLSSLSQSRQNERKSLRGAQAGRNAGRH